jgi:beta-glucanase (GH16 family)
MRFIHAIICISLFFSTTTLSQSWNLIWSDEFNGYSLDTTKWIHDIGTGSQYGLYGWGNNELQYYQPQNTVLNSGSVKIIANTEPNGIIDPWNNTMYYSSSKITTKGKFDFRYGKVEAKIKTIDGEGFWPAFWMLPTNGGWPCDGEIDIMEQWGNDGPSNITTGAAHAGPCPGNSVYQSSSENISSGSYADNFHIYSIEWQPDYIAWYVDNIQFLQVTPSSFPNISWPFNSNNWYLMFNLAITSSGPNSNTVFPSQIEIDYVRVYENIGSISGCTDISAQNYNSNADIDNGSCEYLVNFQVNTNCAYFSSIPSSINITGPSINWSCQSSYSLSDLDGDGIWNGSFVLPLGNFEYIYCADNWSQSEDLLDYGSSTGDWSCTPITDYWSYANRVINITSDTSITNVWGSCSSCIGGCTSPNATNYNSNVNYDDGSCNYSTNFNVTFQVDMNNVTDYFILPELNGSFNNWCGACASLTDVNNDNIWDITLSLPAGYYEYKFSSDNWTIQEDLFNAGNCVLSTGQYTNRVLNIISDTILDIVCWESCVECIIAGCMGPIYCNYDPLANTDDGSCAGMSGCTDPLYAEYSQFANCDDGSCLTITSSIVCAEDAPTGLFVDGIINSRAIVNWDNMNSSSCTVDQYRIKYREVGTSSFIQKTMGGPVGSCTYGNQRVDKLLLNLTGNTNYEYQMKAWYCGSAASLWTAWNTFTTSNDCPNVGNFTVYGANPTKATFDWDASNGSYNFARIKMRIDSISNPVGSDWFQVGGFGVLYGTYTKNKNGLVAGETYRAQARTFCDPNGGAYNSLAWTSLATWRQPTSLRLEGGSAIANLVIYPNPSRDIFNIRFTSEEIQDLRVKVLNLIGEDLINESLEQFVGEYTKEIDLARYTKGVYFLEITTNDGIINKKLILQ